MIYVVGSGPAGVASATALLDQGLEVTLLDAGLQLEPDARARLDEMSRQPPEAWPESSLRAMHEPMQVGLSGVPLKYAYGSSFPWDRVEQELPFELRGAWTRPTLARGGFSTVWGATLLPYLEADIQDWPVSVAELAPHYRAACGILEPAAREDDLAADFPLYADSPRPLRPSPQAAALLADMDGRRDALRAAGFRFGHSRLAVRAEADARGPGCVYCGLCVYGCPYRLIYEAGSTLDALRARPDFHYRPDVLVERLEESGGSVRIRARSLEGRAPLRFQASRVYLACGAVSTTRLLLASLEAFDRPVVMKDSQYFLMPWVRLRRAGNPREQARFTLAQVFLELRDPAVSPHSVHLQIYGYNELYRKLAVQILGPAWPLLRRPADAVIDRTLLIQGYLHSDHSPDLSVSLRRDGARDVLALEARPNPEARATLRRVVSRLTRHWRSFGAIPAGPLMRMAETGRSFHSGGTFPMRERPGEFECDRLGRPHGFSRVHVVDASAFPSIPATTITLSVMANAHRIASAHRET